MPKVAIRQDGNIGRAIPAALQDLDCETLLRGKRVATHPNDVALNQRKVHETATVTLKMQFPGLDLKAAFASFSKAVYGKEFSLEHA